MNCSVTKFNGTYNDDSLMRFGRMRISVNIQTDFPNARPALFFNGSQTVEIIGDYTFTDNDQKTHATEVYDAVNNIYTLDPSVFPLGDYKIDIPSYGATRNIKFPVTNGGMAMANHRSNAVVFNVEDYGYNSPLGMDLAYQAIYGNLGKAHDNGFSKADTIKISDNTAIEGTVKQLFSLAEKCINGERTGSQYVVIEVKQNTSVTGTVLEAVNYAKDIAASGAIIVISGGEKLDWTGIADYSSSYVNHRFTFDGNGGYIFTQSN